MDELPSVITICNWSNFCRTFEHKWNVLDYPKEKLEWIIVDTSSENHSDLIPLNDDILYIHIKSEDYLDKIKFKNDDDKILWTYFEKTKKIPYGFMRDYAVGLSSNEYIAIDFDTIYGPNTIKRKLNFK